MTRTSRLALAFAALLLAAAPAAAPAATGEPATKAAPNTAAKPAARPAAKPAAAAAGAAGNRRLDDVRIEGELEVPRVTFITVRQPHRFRDYTRASSLRPARRMAADATLPAWIEPLKTPASDARKETRK